MLTKFLTKEMKWRGVTPSIILRQDTEFRVAEKKGGSLS
jgi:hypothetical protein